MQINSGYLHFCYIKPKILQKRRYGANKKRLLKQGRFLFRSVALHRPGEGLYIVIQKKLVGMRTQLDGINLVGGLVFNPAVDYVFGKNIAL